MDELDPRTDLPPLPDPETSDLKALPFVGFEVVRLALDPDTSVPRLESVIQTDVALTQRLLRVANSAFYSRGYPVQSVREAVVQLGLTELRRITVTTSVLDFMADGLTPEFDRHAFFIHCLAVGSLSQEICEALGYEDPPIAFVAGLLHDVGKTFFDQHYPETFGKALRLAHRERLSLRDAERAVFAKEVHPLLADHAAMGRWALRSWKLPEVFAEVAGRHHEDALGHQDTLIQVVHCADLITRHLGLGSSGCGDEADWPSALATLGLPMEDLIGAIREGIETAGRMGDVAGIKINCPSPEALYAALAMQGQAGEEGEPEVRFGHG